MIYIIILVYNNWKDTIECLESVFKLKGCNYRIVVVDNNSPNNALEYIKKWAEGKILLDNKKIKFKQLVFPVEIKPIKYEFFTHNDIKDNKLINVQKEKLVLIQTGENKGYSAGNNIGIKYALQDNDCKYVWILNNDVIVEPFALKNMVKMMEENFQIGICGSRTYSYYLPNILQCKGGFNYNKWLGCQYKIREPFNIKHLKYVNGSSMLVRKEFIEKIGFLNESYFLYYEEIDWAVRGKKYYKLGYCEDSIIYHKEGASINKGNQKRSLLSDFYSIRNRILITKRYYKYCLPTVYFGILVAIFNRIRRKEYKRAWIFLKIMFKVGKIKYVE